MFSWKRLGLAEVRVKDIDRFRAGQGKGKKGKGSKSIPDPLSAGLT